VATQRTTERELRRDLALSTTAPEMAATVDDGLHSAAPRSAAKGSDDMAAMRYYFGPTAGVFRRTRRRVVGAADKGKVVNAEGRVRGKAIVRLGSGGMGSFLSSRPTQVSRPISRCHVACNSLIGYLILF